MSQASSQPISSGWLDVRCVRGSALGVDVLRGFARLCDLAAISQADIYDSESNPTGTQRDLSPKHARDAYLYVQEEDLAYWPEILLCARDAEVWKYAPEVAFEQSFGTLSINVSKARGGGVKVSRVDGNHRLEYGGGAYEGYPPITKLVSFSLAVGLNLEQEIKLFRDINNNQRRMNTSHLENITLRLSSQNQLISRDPRLYIADRLAHDSDSPLCGLVYTGGSKDVRKVVPLKTLKTGLEYMFSRPSRLSVIDDIDVQIKVIKNYFSALRRWQPEAWEKPRAHVLLRGAAFWGVCFLGAEVIDRVLARGRFKSEDMLAVLRSGKDWDWSNRGDFVGLSGRGGAVRIRDMIVSEFAEDEGVSIKSLMKRISDEL